MTWLQQALHVAKKDLRMSRWFLALYVFVLVAAIPAASSADRSWSELVPFVVVLVAFGYIATTVQADSAYRADAFWATRPLQQTAVWGGKVLTIMVVLVGLGVAAKAAALTILFGAGTPLLTELMVESAATFASMLLLAALIAAITPDLRSFSVVAIIFLLMPYAMQFMGAGWSRNFPIASRSAFVGAIAAGVLLLLVPAHVYATRRRTLAIGLAAILTAIPAVSRSYLRTGNAAPLPVLISESTLPALHLWRDPGTPETGSGLKLSALLEGEDHRYAQVLHSLQGVLHLPDGSTEEIRFPATYQIGTIASPPAIGNLAWLEYDRNSDQTDIINLPLSVQQREMVLSRKARVTLHGFVDVFKPTIESVVAAEEGERVAKDGSRMVIDRLETIEGTVRVHVTTSGVDRPVGTTPTMQTISFPHFGLINREKRTGVVLDGGGSRYGTGIVIPGGGSSIRTWRLTAAGFLPTDTIQEVSLLDGGEIVHFSWQQVGRKQVWAELRLDSGRSLPLRRSPGASASHTETPYSTRVATSREVAR